MRSAAIVCLVLLASARLNAGEETLEPAPSTGYEILAVRVGRTERARRDLFIDDPTLAARIPVAFAFWVLRGQDRVILVDTGFVDRRMKKRWNVVDYVDPATALKGVGISTGQVTDIIITHRHWDHIGGLVLFATPRVWIARSEFLGARRMYKRSNPGLFEALKRLDEEGRLHFTGPMERILPGVAVVSEGLHTAGCQYVVVDDPDGVWILASDAGPLYANFERRKPSGQTSDARMSRAVLERMIELVGGDIGRIVPGHEPAVFENFPSIIPGVVRLSPRPGD